VGDDVGVGITFAHALQPNKWFLLVNVDDCGSGGCAAAFCWGVRIRTMDVRPRHGIPNNTLGTPNDPVPDYPEKDT
jgi:hypothetical protein